MARLGSARGEGDSYEPCKFSIAGTRNPYPDATRLEAWAGRGLHGQESTRWLRLLAFVSQAVLLYGDLLGLGLGAPEDRNLRYQISRSGSSAWLPGP